MAEPHRIGGRYELGELLGRGGMAEVRKGTDVRLGRTVAIKRLRTDLASDATFQARFRREAQSAASLNHPAIVSVYDTGEEFDEGLDGHGVAQPYIVMEYVAGRTLREILREGRKILPERALEITSGVLSALDYSHRAGIVHRDIKPGNVMLTPAGDVKVMDFGIARAVSDAQSTMTQTAAVVGTAQYLSPEQARGETVDSRSDVYSTGCLLYELLTGRPPFVGDSPVAVAYQHVREQPVPPSQIEEDLDPEVDAIVMKALAKKVEDRYQSAAAMRADIDRYLAGKPVEAPTVVGAAIEEPTSLLAATTATAAVDEGEEEPDNRKRRRVVALLALLLLALIILAIIFLPKLIQSAPPQQSVPTITGLTRTAAEQALKGQQLKVGHVTKQASSTVAKGRIISQDPQAGHLVDQGSRVDFVLSTGKPSVTVPDVIGDNKDLARQELEGRHLKVRLKPRQSDENADDVIAMNPNAGARVSEGTLVTLVYSTGPREVPYVIGKTEAEAKRLIRARGFDVSVVHDPTTQAQKGTVTQQSPGGGTPYGQGNTVTIVVSTFEQPSPTPTPTPTPSESPTPTESPSPSESSSSSLP
ncbi:MAG TPA: Stk1 family PASTA domain-containing Ser/Thr kinase [Marmoricola sp.]|nr:Stk1 family PASTA domain-containing Ser/Thr kinase [Marmoricola sp.]